MEQNLQFTRRIGTIFHKEIVSLQFISRHKLLAALDDYQNTDPANRLIRTKRLEKLCREAGLDPARFIRDPAIVEQLPTAQQVLQTRLPQAFYRLYRATPTSGDYMARLVRRLAPDYAHLPVRLAIVKTALPALGEGCKSLPTADLIRWAQARMTDEERAACDALPPAERLQRLADTLDDTVFDRLRQPDGAGLTPAEVLGCMETRLRKDLAAGILPPEAVHTVEGDACLDPLLAGIGCAADALPDKLTALKTALNDGTLDENRLNAALTADRFEPFHKAFRRRLSDAFAQSGASGKKNPAALYKDNLKDAKNKRKKAAGDWTLLRLADDLAGGVFRPNGATLKQLYYFAFLFGLQAPHTGADSRYDLEQALFRDYHAENTLQQLLHHTKTTESAAIDTVVSCGINWKNYAEMCYLYWLPGGGTDAQGSLLPGQRIDRAEAMIDRCCKAAATAAPQRRTAPTQHTLTAYYREQARHFFALTEPAARDYLVANYRILTAPGVTRLEAAADTNTAYRHAAEQRAQLARTPRMDPEDSAAGRDHLSPQLLALADRLQTLLKAPYAADSDYCTVVDALHRRLFLPRYPGADASPELLLAVLYQLCRTGVPMTAAALRDTLERRQIFCRGSELPTAINRLRAIGFVITGRDADTADAAKARYRLTLPADGTPQLQLVRQLQALAYFHTTDSALQLLQNLLETASPTRHRISRTEFVALHALNYLEQYGMNHSRMQDIVQEFCNDIDWDLEQARYQTLSSKNLFDVYILLLMFVFSAQDTASYAVPLTYRLGGGFNPDENPANHLIGQALTLAAPTRAGYRFVGWRTAPGAAPQPQLTLAPYDFTHYTLTAVWEKHPLSPLP